MDEEIESIDSYDFRRARLSVSLKWILSAAYGAAVPKELREPLPLREKDTLTAIYVNTGLVSLLVNGKLYNEACSKLFPHLADTWKEGGHWSVIQGLSRLGVYVLDDAGQAVTEKELTQTDPLHLTAHVCLVESIIKTFIQDTATTGRVVQEVKAIGPFNASDDLPYDNEDALLLWVNKVCAAAVKRQASEFATHQQQLKQNSTTVKIRRELLSVVEGPHVSSMDDILKDACDGCNIAVLISFYCPSLLPFSDIHLKEPVGIADSLHNLSLTKQFCDQHLPLRLYHFNPEDILYSTETIKPYLLAFVTQLFQYLAIQPLDIVESERQTISPVKLTYSVQSNSKMVREAEPVELISSVTKQSFQKSQNRLKNSNDHYGSNPSLNSSPASSQSYGKHPLLPKRSALHSNNNSTSRENMHDVLSPIVVRKSRSMMSLNAPDPSQSLVAWGNKPHFVDRVKNGTHTEKTGLLANVSICDEQDDASPEQSIDLSELTSVSTLNSSRRKQQSPAPSKSHAEPSNSYKKLLDRSNDLDTPLKQFAKKHGYSLPETDNKDETSQSTSTENDTPTLTQVTPRSDLSPREHKIGDRQTTPVGYSYVIDSRTTAEQAHQAGVPVVDDLSTEVSFTSLAASKEQVLEEDDNSPIAPITFMTESLMKPSPLTLDDEVNGNSINCDSVQSPITSFVDMHMEKMDLHGVDQSADVSSYTSAAGLRNYYMRQLAEKKAEEERPAKKTTFAVNMTTWQDNARANIHDNDSDTTSESSEASLEKKQSTDVRILLEERRKAMEKKKNLADLERTRELNNCSRDAFLKAVARQRTNGPHRSASAPGEQISTPFSRMDITKSIESLQNKWVKDEESNAKRAAATTPAKRISVTPATLDNISEVGEADSDLNKRKSSTPTRRTSRQSSQDHEEPLDMEQFGLDKLNESLGELKGEMQRLTAEQKSLRNMQQAIVSQSIPAPKLPEKQNTTVASLTAPPTEPAHSDAPSMPNHESSDHLSTLDSTFEIDAAQSVVASSPLRESGSDFTQPASTSIIQSTEQPFVLHNGGTPKSDKKKQPIKSKSSPSKSVSDSASTPSTSGFLSSSQLSKKKLTTQKSEPNGAVADDAQDMSDGRKRWTSQAAPLFPGYDDNTPKKSSERDPVLDYGTPGAFQPPAEESPARLQEPTKPSRRPIPRPASMQLGNMVPIGDDTPTRDMQQAAPVEDTPMRVARSNITSSNGAVTALPDTLSTQVLPNRDMDTPMRDAVRQQPERDLHHSIAPSVQEMDTPLRRQSNRTPQHFHQPEMDTPMRMMSQQPQPVHQQSTEFASSRHGTAPAHPHATSRHGTQSLPHANQLQATFDHDINTPERDSARGYQLQTPYGTAENSARPVTNLSLSSVMENIRNDFVKRESELPSPSQSVIPAYPSHGQQNAQKMNVALADIGSPQSEKIISFGHEDLAKPLSPSSAPNSTDSDDRASIASGDSGSGKPKRATWDMSTPRGDVLNTTLGADKSGIGFVIATDQVTEDELRKRKEKIMMMQLKRREENERKKNRKEAELATKREAQRQKEELAERKKAEEKTRKDALLQEYKLKKAEEDLPPEMRAFFRQKQAKKERMQWSVGTGDDLFQSADDTSSSFTVMTGSLTHRRPSSPATTGSSTNRSKAPSRGPVELTSEEYSGPKLYVKPSEKSRSNRSIIINAISHCCLAGVVNTDNKNKVLEGIAKSDGKHFLILFRDGNQTYKAIYSYNADSEECLKVHGQGPKIITNDMCHRFYKYNSGGKNFTEVMSTKHLSVSLDAITIQNHLWAKRPGKK